ncbi:MAG: pyruvate:ferredoxin (flavodoxin) oxidoreductase, partial [Clostridia bacterium]
SLGGNMAQTIKAFEEAVIHNGPSIIFAYAPCINHGIDMSKTIEIEKEAVTSSYFPIYRYSKESGLIIDSPQSNTSYLAFAMQESRYKALTIKNPTSANSLLSNAETFAKKRETRLKNNSVKK